MRSARSRRSTLGVGEIVAVRQPQPGAAPRTFIWRGKRYRVRAVEPLAKTGKGLRSGRALLCVRTESGLRATLSYEARSRRWRMESVLVHKGG